MRRGFRFTLVELLTVTAVIAVLVSLLVPILSAAREKAAGISCLSGIRRLSDVYLLYSADYDDYLPCLNNIGAGKINIFGKKVTAENWLDEALYLYGGTVEASVYAGRAFRCPETSAGNDAVTDYGLNYLIATDGCGGIRISEYKYPDQTAMLVENYGHLCYFCGADNPYRVHQTGSASYSYNRAVFFRHRGAASVLFLDGHAASKERVGFPCREVYPYEDNERLRNCIFNSGAVDASRPHH